jgi:nucleoid-associated protein YgaU
MPTKQISIDLEESLGRRFKARVAYLNTSMAKVLADEISTWVGVWGSNTMLHTVAAGEDLRSIAQQYYGNADLYLAIAYFNDLADPEVVQPGQQLLIPDPGISPLGLVPHAAIPEGGTRTGVSVDIDEGLHRRFKAKAAFEGTSMTVWLYDFVARWIGSWPAKTASYTVRPGDSLGAIAYRFYGDYKKYWVIAYLNGIANPSLIRVGEKLTIPEPAAPGQLPAGESPYIFGIHDPGGEQLMADKKRKGWVLVTEEIGRNPHDYSGKDYSPLQNAGYGVIVRLNHGYANPSFANYPGTIPERDSSGQNYQDFAVRCGNFAENSTGCHIWIIGNEMNHPNEWPGGPQGQMIAPEMYADCYKRCYTQIHRRAGHGPDQVVVGAVAPWNASTQYLGNERGDWIKYLADTLALLGGKCDGIALHAYTHGPEPTRITSFDRMDAPFKDRYYEFRTYRQFMQVIPPSLRGLPVYVTETDQNDPWARRNTGWVQAAYAEIDEWNQDETHQKIRCLLLYRWLAHDQWSFADTQEVKDDFRAALSNDYRWWR